MRGPGWQSTAAWRELMDGLAHLDGQFLDGPRAVGDEQAVAEGYRMLATGLGVALDAYLFADPARPAFVDVNTPFRRDRSWGGDNTDAYYSMATLDPTRHYRVHGRRGDSTYFSLTVYNEPSPGQWSNRIVGIVNDTDLEIDEDGGFSLLLGPRRPDGYTGAFIELAGDTHVAFTRDYQLDPAVGRRVTWEIEALDPPGPRARTDAGTADALRAALTWVQTLFLTVPLTVAPRDAVQNLGHNSPQLANEFADPYQVPDANFGWSARDACYAFASYRIASDEALVITHRPPACRFWNLVVWNPFLATEVLGDARTSINNGAAVPNEDGTVTIVVAHDDLGHPNAVTTADHAEGALAFRWFLAGSVPERPEVEVVPASDAPRSPT
jgi:hypothetical protein